MAYLQASGGEPIPHQTIREAARLLGLCIPEDDLPPLSIALRDQLAAGDRIAALDLQGISPARSFEVRWYE